MFTLAIIQLHLLMIIEERGTMIMANKPNNHKAKPKTKTNSLLKPKNLNQRQNHQILHLMRTPRQFSCLRK